jgi:DNA-binding NarL/FixJ family response regulator
VHSQTAARDLPFLPTLSKPRTTPIRILIADGHPVIREGLIAIFESQKDMKVIAEAADGQQACDLCYQLCPDVLLLDLRIPGKDGFQVITDLMSRPAPRPRIVAMTTYESEEDRSRALKAGAEACLVKGTCFQEIREAVREAGSEVRSCSLRIKSCGAI